MKAYVAEKPKLGKAIAAVLAKSSPKVDSGREFIAGRDWVVCWAAGHIFAQEEPDFYIGAKYPGAPKGNKGRYRWSRDHLLLIPGVDGWPDWRLTLDPEKKSLFATIKKFVGQATVVVNAGDPDREGQLLIDEILHEIGNKKPVRRVLISAFDETTVENGLRDERDNEDFKGLRDAALARSRADWLCGMNFSREVTLQAQESGYEGSHVSIGRVQTPLLGLIVQRDLEIERFKPVDYFSLSGRFRVDGGEFKANWRPHEGQAGLDEDGRLLDRRVADQLNQLVSGKAGQVTEYKDEEKREGPPLPFSVDKLQVLASRKYGYKSDDVLEALQSLYQTHELTTYPRSDCQYLPEGQLADASRVTAAVTGNLSFDDGVLSLVDQSRKSRAWNDKRVTAHHAIIPTATRKADLSSLSKIERDMYTEICKRYLAQFLPDRKYRAVSAMVNVAGQNFVATGTTTLFAGWKVIYGASEEADPEEGSLLPPMKRGDVAHCLGLDITARKTEPPQHFTDGTLLEAMINVHKYVTEEAIKAIFVKMLADKKAGDEEGGAGLGTPATRHTFVPKLVDIGLVESVDAAKLGKKKSKETFIISTAAGRALIAALPPELGKPDMTALWESAMSQIEAGSTTVERFLTMQKNWIGQTAQKIRSTKLDMPAPANAKPKPRGGSAGYSGKPKSPARDAGKNCPKCDRPMKIRNGAKGDFMGCSGFPKCTHTEQISTN